jgi:2-haloacid dehalogenase
MRRGQAQDRGLRDVDSRVAWITFDCYGTLVDWESGIADALAPFLPPPVDRMALAARYIALEATVEQKVYRPYRDVLAETSGRLMSQLGHPLPPERGRVLPDSLPSWRPFPEVTAALRTLRASGYRLAILSNADRDLLRASVAQLGIVPDLLITAEECRSYKPAPGHWEQFRARSGASPGRTVHVGASLYHDMVPAGSLGYRTVFINRHGETVGDVRPTRVLPDLRSLPQTISALDGRPEGNPPRDGALP